MADLKYCAQWGEDRLIWEYFGPTSRGFFAEIGVNDPEIGSKTYLLEEHVGARFPFTSLKDRIKVFRKIRLGTPFRQTNLRLRGKKS